MMTFSYRDPKWQIFKDLCFTAAGVWMLTWDSFLARVLGLVLIIYYLRDVFLQIRVLRYQKRQERQERGQEDSGIETEPVQDDGKITVTDLSDAKEVDFRKE